MLDFADEDPDSISRGYMTTSMPLLLKGKYVHLTAASDYEFVKGNHCELAVVQERLFHDTLAVHLQKGSPYTKMFNHV